MAPPLHFALGMSDATFETVSVMELADVSGGSFRAIHAHGLAAAKMGAAHGAATGGAVGLGVGLNPGTMIAGAGIGAGLGAGLGYVVGATDQVVKVLRRGRAAR